MQPRVNELQEVCLLKLRAIVRRGYEDTEPVSRGAVESRLAWLTVVRKLREGGHGGILQQGLTGLTNVQRVALVPVVSRGLSLDPAVVGNEVALGVGSSQAQGQACARRRGRRKGGCEMSGWLASESLQALVRVR